MVKIFFPFSLKLKTYKFSGKDLVFFCFGIYVFLGRKPTSLTVMTFFWSSPIFGPKRGDTSKFRPGATIQAMPLSQVKITKLSHPFSHQFGTVLFWKFCKFEILSETNFSRLDENLLLRKDSVYE